METSLRYCVAQKIYHILEKESTSFGKSEYGRRFGIHYFCCPNFWSKYCVFFILLGSTPLAWSSYPRYLTSQGFLKVLGGHPSRLNKKAAQRCSMTSRNSAMFVAISIFFIYQLSCLLADPGRADFGLFYSFSLFQNSRLGLHFKRPVLIFVLDS